MGSAASVTTNIIYIKEVIKEVGLETGFRDYRVKLLMTLACAQTTKPAFKKKKIGFSILYITTIYCI